MPETPQENSMPEIPKIPTPPNVPIIEGSEELLIINAQTPHLPMPQSTEQYEQTRTTLFPAGSPRNQSELQEWLKTLSEDEMRIVRQLGFKFHFIKGILSEPKQIALPEEEPSGEGFAFSEVMDLLREIVDDARELLAEGDKHQDPLVKQMRPFYNYLTSLVGTNWGQPNNVLDGHFIQAVKRIPRDLRRYASPHVEAGEKEQLKQKNKEHLKLNDNEEQLLLEAMERTIRTLHKMKEGKHVTPEELGAILSRFKQMERFRTSLRTSRSKRQGFDEIERLLEFVPSWIEILEMVHQQSQRYKRTYLNLHAKALEKIFPNEITPLLTVHHREVRECRLQAYEKLAQIVDGIDDYHLKKTTKRILLQISTILTYLDFMWDMHEITVDQHNKQIIYPKQMMLIAPLIYREMNILLDGLQQAVKRLQSDDESTEEIIDIEFSTHEIDKRDDSQPGFRIGENNIDNVAVTSEEVVRLINGVINPDSGTKNGTSLDKKAASCFDSLELQMSACLKEARRALSLTKVHKTDVHPDRSEHLTIHHGETLSYHIQDFITYLNSGLIHGLAHIANTFHNGSVKLLRRDIIPEYQDYEDQTARLRLSIEQLKQGSQKTKTLISRIAVRDPDNMNPAPMLMTVKESLRQVADSIRRFQQRRDDEIAEGNYYGVLKGKDYDALQVFTDTVKDFFLDRNCDTIGIRAIATHTLLKELDGFATKISALPRHPESLSSPNIDAWMKTYRGLTQMQNEVHRCQSNEGVKEELKSQYGAQCLELIHNMLTISRQEPCDDERQREFREFADTHPFAQDVQPEDFNNELLAFQKVINQFEDFHSALGMDDLVDKTLLTEYKHRASQRMIKYLFVIAKSLKSEKPNPHKSEEVLQAMQICAEINADLEFTDAQLAAIIHQTLSYLSSFPDYMEAYHAEIRATDFSNVVDTIQYLCTELHRRFRIPD